MIRSIQEFLRKINSHLEERLTFIDFIGIIGTILIISGLFLTLTVKDLYSRKEITYIESDTKVLQEDSEISKNESLLVASKNGKTYFYSWCKGVERIKAENIITFQNEDEAKATGRRIASGCTQ